MPYHIIVQQTYDARRVPCGPDCGETGGGGCRIADPREHIPGLCGADLIRHQSEYCAIGIANPKWDRDWCPGCLCRVGWTSRQVDVLERRGFLEGRETARAGMRFMANAREITDRERGERFDRTMAAAREGRWEEFEPALADWLRQVVEHADRGGPAPEYWPVVEQVEPRC